MFVIDTPISLLAGAAIAYKASNTDEKFENRDRAFARGLLLQSLLITPLTVFFLLRFPDWQLSYLIDAHTTMKTDTGAWMGLFFMIWLNAFYVVGFNVAATLINTGRRQRVLQLIYALLAVITVVTTLVFDATLYLGSSSQYHAGTAPSSAANYEFLAVVFIGLPLWLAGYFWAIRAQKYTR